MSVALSGVSSSRPLWGRWLVPGLKSCNVSFRGVPFIRVLLGMGIPLAIMEPPAEAISITLYPTRAILDSKAVYACMRLIHRAKWPDGCFRFSSYCKAAWSTTAVK